MDIWKKITKTVSKEIQGLARSQVRSLAKQKLTGLTKQIFAKSPEQLQEEIEDKLGFVPSPSHWKQNKNGEIEFKSSPLFVHEFLTRSPDLVGRLIKDEESNKIYFDDVLLSNNLKLDLIAQYSSATEVKSTAINSHFENALKLITSCDYTSKRFASEMKDWNGSKVIETWLDNVFQDGLVTDKKYATMLFEKWIIGAAGRIMEPGSLFQGTLVLVGPPGLGKTLHFRNLLPAPFEDRCGEIVCQNIKDPAKLTEAIVGKSIACFDEMSVLEGGKITETFKQFLTLQEIQARLAWQRAPVVYKLRQAFCGTTNQTKFIKDDALLRRLWIIELNENAKIDFDYLNANRKTLWQEAVAKSKDGWVSYLSKEEQKQVQEYNSKFKV